MTSQTYGSSAGTGSSGGAQAAADSAKSAAQGVAGTAKQEASHVASVATEQGKVVAGEATEQGRQLLGELRSQVGTQARSQQESLRSLISDMTSELRSMADSGNGGVASTLARQAADRAEGLASYLESREPADLLDDVRQFARRRPGTFLVGAALAGVVAGRFVRSVRDDAGSGGQAVAALPAGSGTTSSYETTGTTGTPTGLGTYASGSTRPSPTGLASSGAAASGAAGSVEGAGAGAWTPAHGTTTGSGAGISSVEGTGGAEPHGTSSIDLPGESADIGTGAGGRTGGSRG